MWWGLTPALDLVDECKSLGVKPHYAEGENVHKAYNILLIGQGDNRHVLKTLAQKYRHEEEVQTNFFICEPLLENVAKELLFLTLALEPPENLGLMEKAHLYMELYGNSLIRPTTANYLCKVSERLLSMISNLNYAEKILPSVSFDNLKFKERDQIETIFKYWSKQDNTFDVVESWNNRVRTHLGTRYDSRAGVYDWDYYMRYKPYGGDVINYNEYKHFRETGVAFLFDDTDPCIPNKTLGSAIFSAGSKISSYGYMGDIITGPFVSFGLDCEDKDMLRKVNGIQARKSRDVTERNLMRLFYELQTQSPFVVPGEEIDGVYITTIEEKHKIMQMVEKKATGKRGSIRGKPGSEVYQSLQMAWADASLLSASSLKDFTKKEQFQNFFDLVTIPHNMVLKHFTPDMMKMFKKNARIIVETPRYVLEYRKEDLEKFKTDVSSLMTDVKCEVVGTYEHLADNFARFKVVK